MESPKASINKTSAFSRGEANTNKRLNPEGLAPSSSLKRSGTWRRMFNTASRVLTLRLESGAIAKVLTREFFSLRQKNSLVNSITQTRRFQEGFTFIEILVVIGMLAIIGALGLFMNMESMRGGAFRDNRNLIVSSLQRARSLAVNNICVGGCTEGVAHGVHFETASVTIFQGQNYNPAAPTNESVPMSSNTITIDATAAPGGNIVFDNLSGNLIPSTATSTSVSIKDNSGHTSKVEVNSEGRIDWTN